MNEINNKVASDFNQEDEVNIKDFQESLTDYTTNEVPSFVRLSDKYKDITSSALCTAAFKL